jgi:ABC-type multidrug transport system ATPase subunit
VVNPGPAAPVLQIRGLGFAHPGQPPLFDDWSHDVPAGVSRIDGESGSGKTSLLRLLAGEWRGSGELILQGRRQSDDLAAWQAQVFWFDACDEAHDALTPHGLMAALRLRHPALDVGAWQEHLVGFGLLPHRAKPLYMLSSGSRRKAGLAVALSAGCALTLLDEPTAGLDAASIRYLAAALDAVNRDPRRALLLVTSLGLDDLCCASRINLPA